MECCSAPATPIQPRACCRLPAGRAWAAGARWAITLNLLPRSLGLCVRPPVTQVAWLWLSPDWWANLIFPSVWPDFFLRSLDFNWSIQGNFRSFWPYDITIGRGTRFMPGCLGLAPAPQPWYGAVATAQHHACLCPAVPRCHALPSLLCVISQHIWAGVHVALICKFQDVILNSWCLWHAPRPGPNQSLQSFRTFVTMIQPYGLKLLGSSTHTCSGAWQAN